MDAIQFLKEEHGKAKAAFAKVEEASAHHRASLWQELTPELELHERMEEACLYGPLAQDAQHRDAALAQWNRRHAKEVAPVKGMIRELDSLDPRDSRWSTTLKQVRERLENHIREEEIEIFPRIGLVWNRDRLERAGAELERMKAEESRRAA